MRRSRKTRSWLFAALLGLAALPACQARLGTGQDVAPETVTPAPGGASVERLVVGFGRANCYVLWGAGSPDAIVVDPGGEASRIHRTLGARGLRCAAIVHTHGHGDHVGGSHDLQALTGAPIHRHPRQPELRRPSLRPGASFGELQTLGDGDVLRVGGLAFDVIHTPGHSPGSICLFGHGILVTGDLLFAGSVGRTDLSGGSDAALQRSLHQALARVPDDTRVLPGHGDETTMGRERRTNRWLKR